MLSFARLLPLLFAGLLACPAIAQPELHPVPRTAVFDKTFCIRQINHAASVIALADGGFAAAGHTNAKGAGSWDAWVIRLDAAGGVLWEKTYGGPLDDSASSIAALPDGGFIVAGSFHSWDKNKGDGWLLRLDAKGEVLWEKTYGSKLAAFASVAALPDGGFIAAGRLHEKPASYWKSMAWVLRLDANGDILWEQSFSGQVTARASGIAQLSDGGFAVAANVHAPNSDEEGIHIIRLGAGGNFLSDQTFRDLENGPAQSISALPGGGFAVAGSTDWSPDRKYARKGYAWVLRFGAEDKLLWEKKFGSAKSDGAMSIAPAADGGWIVAGGIESKGAGGTDAWLIRLDRDGEVLWDKTYGGKADDSLHSIHALADGGFIAAGETNSKSPDGSHAWVMRLDAAGATLWEKTFGPKGEGPPRIGEYYRSHSDAKAVAALPDGGLIAAGVTAEKGPGKKNACIARFDASGAVVWERTYGDAGTSLVHSVVALPDGGFAAAGQRLTEANFAAARQRLMENRTEEAWIFRLDANGEVLWEKAFGSTSINIAASIAVMPGGGIVAAGIKEQRKHHGELTEGGNGWVVRLSSSGDLLWEKVAGESSMLTAIAALPDGGVIAAGAKDYPTHQAWLFRLDSDGKLSWEKPIASGESRWGLKIAVVADGGFAVSGWFAPKKDSGERKAWATRFDKDANVLWDKVYEGKALGASAIAVLPDGGFALAGMTVQGRFGLYDAWVARLDADGGLMWEETYGGISEDSAHSIAVTPDGSLAVGGTTAQRFGMFEPQAWLFTVPVEQQGARAQ